MMGLGDIVSGLWSFLVNAFEKLRSWSVLHLRMGRGVAGLLSAMGLPGLGMAVTVYRWGTAKVQAYVADPTGTMGLPVTVAQVSNAAADLGGSWLAKANYVFPVSESITVLLALLTFAGSCAVLKLVLAAVRDLVPTGG